MFQLLSAPGRELYVFVRSQLAESAEPGSDWVDEAGGNQHGIPENGGGGVGGELGAFSWKRISLSGKQNKFAPFWANSGSFWPSSPPFLSFFLRRGAHVPREGPPVFRVTASRSLTPEIDWGWIGGRLPRK